MKSIRSCALATSLISPVQGSRVRYSVPLYEAESPALRVLSCAKCQPVNSTRSECSEDPGSDDFPRLINACTTMHDLRWNVAKAVIQNNRNGPPDSDIMAFACPLLRNNVVLTQTRPCLLHESCKSSWARHRRSDQHRALTTGRETVNIDRDLRGKCRVDKGCVASPNAEVLVEDMLMPLVASEMLSRWPGLMAMRRSPRIGRHRRQEAESNDRN